MKTLCLLVVGLVGCGRSGDSSVSPSVDTRTKEAPASDSRKAAKRPGPTRVEHNDWQLVVRGYVTYPDGTRVPYNAAWHNKKTGEDYPADPADALLFDEEHDQ